MRPETPRRRIRHGQETPPPEPSVDEPDCLHGCNGDCLTSGSDVCNFMCHAGFGTEALEFAERLFPPMGWGGP